MATDETASSGAGHGQVKAGPGDRQGRDAQEAAAKNAALDASLARLAAEQSMADTEARADLFLAGSDEFEKMARPVTESEGSAPWVLTFADLMSLLLCFFILLFAMAELDVKKFSEVAQALAGALGGGKVIYIKDPGTLAGQAATAAFLPEAKQHIDTEYYAAQLCKKLDEEIKQQQLRVEEEGQIITIHILQNGSFEPGSAVLDPAFLATAQKIRDALVEVPGHLTVAGHTDNLPLVGGRFLSNWELSGARAFAVIHELLKDGVLPAQRFVLAGHADTRPRVGNDTEANREKNRRVEIIIDQRHKGDDEGGSYEFLRRDLGPEILGGGIEIQTAR
jgi:chemotaxis protein MotB